MNAQRKLFDYRTEEECLHDTTRPGYFAVLQNQHDQRKIQSAHRLVEMPKVIQLLDKTKDTWISQAEFVKPNRRVVNLWRVGLLFVDLDTYKLGFSSWSPERQAQALIFECEQEGIPAPSLIVFSGRGLQAKWLLTHPVPRQALPRWNACQRILVDRLAQLGADPMAKDASRVLRLVGAVNTKSGEVARVVYASEANGEPLRYDFDYLCEWLLPIARETLKNERNARKARSEERRFKLIEGGRQASGLRGFSGRQLAWHRLEDLRTLAEMRGGIGEGERMLHLFWQINFLLLSGATNSNQMYHEAASLAREIDPSWSYRSSELMTLYSKAKAHEAGETVEFQGRKLPALYTPRNESLIHLFGITDDEQRQLQTIITPTLARERHAEREKAKRVAAGATPREQSKTALKPWEALGMTRRTWYRKGQPQPVDNATFPHANNK